MPRGTFRFDELPRAIRSALPLYARRAAVREGREIPRYSVEAAVRKVADFRFDWPKVIGDPGDESPEDQAEAVGWWRDLIRSEAAERRQWRELEAMFA